MSSWSKAVIDSYDSAWWQLYLTSLVLGFVSALSVAAWVREPRRLVIYLSLLRLLLYLGVINNLNPLGFTVLPHSLWDIASSFFDRFTGFFTDGVLAASLITSLKAIRPVFLRKPSLPSIALNPQTVLALQYFVASVYVNSGLGKILIHYTLDFFQASGYGTTFFYFIAAWELVWGVGVIWRRSAILALIALTGEMFGAIYTHYHNYFTKGFPGPFGNSVDALRMLGLMAYIAFALMRQQEERTAINPGHQNPPHL